MIKSILAVLVSAANYYLKNKQRFVSVHCQYFKIFFMRSIKFISAVVFFAFVFQGCVKDKVLHTYTIYTPVYQSKQEAYANIKLNPAQAIKNPGKIFLYGNYIFLNEIDKGVHIIDNSNPAAPQVKGFINIPGNLDIAVKGNTLYADLYTDLVVVDIANPLQARFVKFVSNQFPSRNYTNGFVADSNRVIIDWIKKDTTVNVRNQNKFFDCMTCSFVALNASGTGGLSAASPTVGVAGSMARFSLVNNYLYLVNTSNLSAINITDEHNPVQTSTQSLGWGIETIYPFNGKLFIGSTTGMFIYDLVNPANPTRLSAVSHFRSCDPVIADGNFAYVTLRGGATCGGTSNVFNVYDISNLSNPVLSCSKIMTSPHGLAKDGNLIFICDGIAGLKIFDASNSACQMQLIKNITGLETYDVIAWNKRLLLVAKDGLYQYDYSVANDIKQISSITVNR
jgi:hypothetical protein